MSPARNERSVVHPPWMKVQWAWMAVPLFFVLLYPAVFGGASFPILYVLFIAWLLYRSERDYGRNPH